MGLYEYEQSIQIEMLDKPFYALVMGLWRQADTCNREKIEAAWPEVTAELKERINLPGGMYPVELEAYRQREAEEDLPDVLEEEEQDDH